MYLMALVQIALPLWIKGANSTPTYLNNFKSCLNILGIQAFRYDAYRNL